MKSNRREFLSTCAAAGLTARAAVAGEEAQSVGQQTWPSSFPALTQRVNGYPLAFLDSAATTLRPQSVIDALVDYYSTDNANPSRVHTLASRAADRLAAARQDVARFVNASDPSEIIFVRGTTEGVNLIATTWGSETLKADDEIVLTVAEHSSNLMPWTRLARQAGAKLRVVDVDDEGRPRLEQARVRRDVIEVAVVVTWGGAGRARDLRRRRGARQARLPGRFHEDPPPAARLRTPVDDRCRHRGARP